MVVEDRTQRKTEGSVLNKQNDKGENTYANRRFNTSNRGKSVLSEI
jgi:hypothetical protein